MIQILYRIINRDAKVKFFLKVGSNFQEKLDTSFSTGKTKAKIQLAEL